MHQLKRFDDPSPKSGQSFLIVETTTVCCPRKKDHKNAFN